jgi:GTP-binding protein
MALSGEQLFRQPCEFLAGASSVESLPTPGLPEVAFAGRSNVGKSSLINALTNRKALARVSHTPGRTQELNFFEFAEKLRLVDLPGYGFAKVGRKQVSGWQRLIKDYLRGRVTLRRVCLLIDSRHGPKEVDREIFQLLNESAVPFQIVLTKIDELKAGELEQRVTEIEAVLKKNPAGLPHPLAVSSHRGEGMDALRDELAALALG